MNKAEQNLAVIQNFILHLTHSSQDDHDADEEIVLTPQIMYQSAEDYIAEDHVDGYGNPENDEERVPVGREIKTNEDLVRNLMNFSPFGALAQAFIMQAIQNMCKNVKNWEPTEEDYRGFVDPDAWKGIAEDIEKRVNEFYKNK